MPQDEMKSERPTYGQVADLMWHVSIAGAFAVWMFTHRKNGKNCPGGAAIGTAVVILWLAGESHDIRMMNYFWAWLAMLVYRRIETFVCERVHTKSYGYPWITRFLPGSPYVWEIVLAYLAAFAVKDWCKPLHLLWLWSAVSMTYLDVVVTLTQISRRDRIKDAEIEAGYEASRLRGR